MLSIKCQDKYFNLVFKMVERSLIDAEKRNSETDALLRRQIIAKIWALLVKYILIKKGQIRHLDFLVSKQVLPRLGSISSVDVFWYLMDPGRTMSDNFFFLIEES